MAHLPRYALLGQPQHIIQRGNHQQVIFAADADYIPVLPRCYRRPVELIEQLAALIPPPRRQRHRYFGVVAPDAPLRAAVTAPAGS